MIKLQSLFTVFFVLFFFTIGNSQTLKEKKQAFDSELLIAKQGDYYLNNQITKLPKVKPPIKNHLEESDSLLVKLSLEHLVEYSKIERLRKSYKKFIDYDPDYYLMMFNELAWNYNKKLDK